MLIQIVPERCVFTGYAFAFAFVNVLCTESVYWRGDGNGWMNLNLKEGRVSQWVMSMKVGGEEEERVWMN